MTGHSEGLAPCSVVEDNAGFYPTGQAAIIKLPMKSAAETVGRCLGQDSSPARAPATPLAQYIALPRSGLGIQIRPYSKLFAC